MAERIAWLLVDAKVAGELGCRLDAATVVGDVAATCCGGDQATSLLDGRRSSAPGAALVNGTTVNAADIDDGQSVELVDGRRSFLEVESALRQPLRRQI